jgi:hypothetical protein
MPLNLSNSIDLKNLPGGLTIRALVSSDVPLTIATLNGTEVSRAARQSLSLNGADANGLLLPYPFKVGSHRVEFTPAVKIDGVWIKGKPYAVSIEIKDSRIASAPVVTDSRTTSSPTTNTGTLPTTYVDDTFSSDKSVTSRVKVSSIFNYSNFLSSGAINSTAYTSYSLSSKPVSGRHVIDMIGSHFMVDNNDERAEPTAENHNRGDTYCSNGTQPTSRYPVGIRVSDITILGGIFHGFFPSNSPHVGIPQNAWWWASYCNSAAIMFKGSGRGIVDGARITSAWDAVRTDGPDSMVKNSWVSNVRDDIIENDVNYSVTSKDNLYDGVFQAYSSQGGSDRSSNTTLIQGDVVRIRSYAYREDRAGDQVFGAIYKSDANSPQMVIENTVIAVEPDAFKPGRSVGTFTRQWEITWSKIKRCSNNVLLWMPNQGSYSAELSSVTKGIPSCFRVVTGSEARSLWENARKNWINCHPKVGRLNEDTKSDAGNCRANTWGGYSYAD